MSTDDSKEEDGQGNGGREHDLAPGDYGENKTDGAEEGNRGELKKHTEEEKGPEEEEVSSVMLMPGDVTKEKDTYKGNAPPANRIIPWSTGTSDRYDKRKEH